MKPVSLEGKQFESIAMIDEIVDVLEKVARELKPTKQGNKYVVFAVRDLIWVSLSIITSVARHLHWRYNAYTAATMTRLLMECVADIKFIKSHPEEAKAFWESQQEIKNKFQEINEAEKWKLFTDGTLSSIGRLSDGTNNRVHKMLGNDDFGRYNFFCFYSHPNIAGYSWVSYDQTQPGIVIKFAAETYFKMIDEMLRAISSIENQRIDVSTIHTMIAHLQSTYVQYMKECEDGND